VTSPFRLEFDREAARGVRVSQMSELPAAVAALELFLPRPTVVLVGGAGGLDETGMERLRPLCLSALVPMIEERAAVGVDGGTFSGVMRLFGEARSAQAAVFPLVGVVAAGTVRLPGEQARAGVDTVLEPHHTHFVIVPGDEWGAESPWIAQTATVLAGGAASSVTVLINGGQIALSDVERSVDAGRSVIVIAGSGRTADALSDALAGAAPDERTAALAASGLLNAVQMDDPAALADRLAAALGG
jgi:hypothetical protein